MTTTPDCLYSKATGIKTVADKVSEVTGKDCGCSKRKAKLNQLVPFGRKEEGEGDAQG